MNTRVLTAPPNGVAAASHSSGSRPVSRLLADLLKMFFRTLARFATAAAHRASAPLRSFAEIDAEAAGTHFRLAFATVPSDPGQSVELRRGRTVICGSCGPSVSIFDVCQWCNGFATTLKKGGDAAPQPNRK